LKEWTTYAFKDPGDLSACLRDFNTELQQRLAAAEARVKELESRGILNMDEVVNQFYEGE